MHKRPVDCVIDAFGGARQVSEALKISTQAVYRWVSSPKGTIPVSRIEKIIEIARQRRLELDINDLVLGRDT